jgi:LysM repeat protein
MIFFFFAAILMGVVILLSASRGGILSLGVTMLLTAILFLSKNGYRKYGGLALCLCLAILTYGLHVGIDPTLDKFENPKNLYGRLHITRTILPMIRDYPISGVGLGNFRYVYPRYIDDYDRVSSSGYAHNDWVEAGTETGCLGLVLIVSAFVVYLVKMIRVWRRRRDLHALGIGAGAMAGLVAVGLHSYFDFNMHIPANPITLAAVMAVGFAAVHRQGHGVSESFFFPKRKIQLTGLRRFTILILVMLVAGFAAGFTGKHFMAEAACPTEWNSTMNLNWNPELSQIEKAISLNTGNFAYHNKRAVHFMSLNPGNKEDKKANALEAGKSFEQAVRCNPTQGILWYNLGRIYSSATDDMFDYLNQWLPLADACFDAGIKYAPMDEHILFNVAWYWAWRAGLLGEKEIGNRKAEIGKRKGEGERGPRLNPLRGASGEAIQQGKEEIGKGNGQKSDVGSQMSEGFATQSVNGYSLSVNREKQKETCREDGIRKFQGYFQRALALAPRKWEKAAEQTWAYFPDDGVVMGIVPKDDDVLKSRVLRFLAKTEVFELSKTSPKNRYHTVGAGDTLFSIGRRYGVTVNKIRLLNKLDREGVIYPGQELWMRNEE